MELVPMSRPMTPFDPGNIILVGNIRTS